MRFGKKKKKRNRTPQTFCIYSGRAFVCPCVPYSDCLVTTGRGELLWVCGVPTQLVHTVTMALVCVVFPLRKKCTLVSSEKIINKHTYNKWSINSKLQIKEVECSISFKNLGSQYTHTKKKQEKSKNSQIGLFLLQSSC